MNENLLTFTYMITPAFYSFKFDKMYLPRTSKFLDFKGEEDRAEASLLSNADIGVGILPS